MLGLLSLLAALLPLRAGAVLMPIVLAYIEPGTGALLMQSLVGLLAAAVLALRFWGRRLLAAIRAGADFVRIVFCRVRRR